MCDNVIKELINNQCFDDFTVLCYGWLICEEIYEFLEIIWLLYFLDVNSLMQSLPYMLLYINALIEGGERP